MLDEQQTRAELQHLRDELKERLNNLNRDLRHRDEPVAADFAEQVVEQENIEVLYALEGEGKQELVLVESALRRLDQGEYGTCEQCGGEIMAGRLNAVPYASTCIDCAI